MSEYSVIQSLAFECELSETHRTFWKFTDLEVGLGGVAPQCASSGTFGSCAYSAFPKLPPNLPVAAVEHSEYSSNSLDRKLNLQ